MMAGPSSRRRKRFCAKLSWVSGNQRAPGMASGFSSERLPWRTAPVRISAKSSIDSQKSSGCSTDQRHNAGKSASSTPRSARKVAMNRVAFAAAIRSGEGCHRG
jgi:hypothetical protein